jgi:hypothetical protein
MEVPRLIVIRIDRLAEKLHLHIGPSPVMVIPGMKRLVEVAHKVDEIGCS